ncbi:hypothetical protein BC628DRAFT_1348418 [Trametes gibbosa]|nr:hypothetical protein BC628DRAFT_1348418 [Trametes gibbosa]UVI59119.1 Zn(2)-Cys(6)16 [Trametes gibbosa]
MNPYAAELSDDESRKSTAEPSAPDTKGRRRSTRACDHCRRTKSKCEQPRGGPGQRSCLACAALGLSCTFIEPTHKRGPPKGYILALERRLHQVEALLGTIISSDDPRARSLVQDLSRDRLASHIINKVHVGPFGPAGRAKHPFSTTKEDFLASITGELGDTASEQSGSGQDAQSDPSFLSPSSDWQDRMKSLLNVARAEAAMTASASLPPADMKPRRATYPSVHTGHSPVPYSMQAYYAPQAVPGNPPYFFNQQPSLGQSSAMRSSANDVQYQAAGPVSPASNIYTDPDGRFRMGTAAPMPPEAAGHHTTAADAAGQYSQYFDSYRNR